ncbi:MAG TPA: hypothetical protein VLV85_18260 [Stellaceae bacterium]|jgi:hypothetical protein|nr:hypothetical protein [Stellaceae bacterium]
MILRLLLLLSLPLLLAGVVRAAQTAPSEAEMVRLCRAQLEDRLFSGGAHGDAFVTAKSVERRSDSVIVTLDLASGEGRAVKGSCIFRDGKLFDVK